MRINKTITSLVLLSLSLLSYSSFASTCTGLKKCPKPIKSLQQLADRKAPEAQLMVGMLYRQATYYKSDEQEALKWIKRAARQQPRYAFAQHLLGKAYLNGEGVEVNLTRAVRYLKRSAKLGLVDSQRILGEEYFIGNKLEKDIEKARKWLVAAAKQRDFAATIKLVQLLRGSKIRNELREAEYWAAESQSMQVNVRDISERIEIDTALIEKVVERSELWVKRKWLTTFNCYNQNSKSAVGCVSASNSAFFYTTLSSNINTFSSTNHQKDSQFREQIRKLNRNSSNIIKPRAERM